MISKTDEILMEVTGLTGGQFIKLTEENKAKLQDKIVTKLYKSIKKKAISIDFSVIDKSRGKFSSLDNYKDIINSIKFLRKLVIKKGYTNKDMEDAVSVLELAADLLDKYEKYFTKGYDSNSSMIKFVYEGTTTALIQLASYLISDCLSYVDAGGALIDVKVKQSKNIAKLNIYKALKNITDLHKTNKLEKYLKNCVSFNEGVFDVFLWLGNALFMLASLRGIFYLVFMCRIKISEYLNQLATFVELNSSTVTDTKIKEKQKKWVDKLRALSDKIKVDLEVSSARAEDEIKDENEEINASTSYDDLGLA